MKAEPEEHFDDLDWIAQDPEEYIHPNYWKSINQITEKTTEPAVVKRSLQTLRRRLHRSEEVSLPLSNSRRRSPCPLARQINYPESIQPRQGMALRPPQELNQRKLWNGSAHEA